jgi:GT2 family glycosyltransferase
MEIRGQDYRVAVVVMMMEGEFAATKVMMASLRYSLRDERDVTISLLLNGGENEEINAYFTRTEGMIFYSSADNLGIAGGRNFLFTRPEVIGADIIMVLDNDLILPSDYVRRMCTSLVTARGAGIVGPVLVWGRSAKGFLDRRPKTGPKDESAATAPCFSSDDLKRYWVKEGVGDDL